MKTMLLAATALSGPARAFGDLDFDATTVTPDAGVGDPLPTGWYNVAIDEAEMKPTNDGTGTRLNLRFDVLDGQYKGRKLFEGLNMKNANAQTVEIARRQLSAICHAIGILKPASSAELKGHPLKVRVGQKKAEGGYDAGNKITAYKNINEQVDTAGGDSGAASFAAGATPPPTAFGGAPTPPPAATGGANAPWATGAAQDAAAADTPVTPPAPTPPAAPPAPPAAPAAPPAVPAHDPLEAAKADGWAQHPSSPPHMYKGQEVKEIDAVKALYPAPAAPAAPEAPAAPPAPPAAPAGDAQQAPPPWANK